MPEKVIQGLQLIARWLEIVGAAALIVGFLVASSHWIRNWTKEGLHAAGVEYRRALGRTVLIGLEVLVAATIIKTTTLQPTLEGISLLAIMILIRTVLGWTMILEMYGHWPWQRPNRNTATAEPVDK